MLNQIKYIPLLLISLLYSLSFAQLPKDSLLLSKTNQQFYSFSNSYSGDRTTLKNAKEQNLMDSNKRKIFYKETVIIEEPMIQTDAKRAGSRIIIRGNNLNSEILVSIDNKSIVRKFNHSRLCWKINDKGYFYNNVISIKGFDKVIIENISLELSDPELINDFEDVKDLKFTNNSTIKIDDCKNVEIRDCYFAGIARRYHLEIVNCKNTFIDRVEIAGLKFGKNYNNPDSIYYVCGGGINIKNDKFKPGDVVEGFLNVIQNCYIYNNSPFPGEINNRDGINTSVAANTLIFNCFIENWGIGYYKGKGGADCAIDISEPAVPVSIKNYVFRAEHNIFKNCKAVKNSYSYFNKEGCNDYTMSDTIINSKLKREYKLTSINNFDCIAHLYCGNKYINTAIWDYCYGYSVYYLYESFVFDDSASKKYLYKYEGDKLSRTVFKNNVIMLDINTSNFKLFNIRNFNEDKGSKDDILNLEIDNNYYLFKTEPAVLMNFVNNKTLNIKNKQQLKLNKIDNKSLFEMKENFNKTYSLLTEELLKYKKLLNKNIIINNPAIILPRSETLLKN